MGSRRRDGSTGVEPGVGIGIVLAYLRARGATSPLHLPTSPYISTSVHEVPAVRELHLAGAVWLGLGLGFGSGKTLTLTLALALILTGPLVER